MKSKLLILITVFCGLSFTTVKCPQKGDSPKLDYQKMDLLKNRTTTSTIINKNITLEKILQPGDDINRFSSNDYADITGYVYDVKWGGAETCNCHSKDKSQLDIHIELVTTLIEATDKKIMVVEITRYSKGVYTYEQVKRLKGKKVRVKGWMFFDEEHKQNAFNTRPNGTNLWRGTCWEIHPCQSIEEIKGQN